MSCFLCGALSDTSQDYLGSLALCQDCGCEFCSQESCGRDCFARHDCPALPKKEPVT